MKSAEAIDGSVLLPSPAFVHLRRALRREAGPLGAIHALHDAGFATGRLLFEAFAEQVDPEPPKLDEARFWASLDRFLDSAGWGRVRHERIHPGLGMLHAREWRESDPDSSETQPSCAFSAGMFAHILGRVAGGPIAVLEVGCRSRGDAECSFLFGSEGAIHEVYGHLLEGASLDNVLENL